MNYPCTNNESTAWIWMWGSAITIYSALKLLSWHFRTRRNANVWVHAAYLFGWPGMDADQFLSQTALEPQKGIGREWGFAVLNLCLGLLLVAAAVANSTNDNQNFFGWTGMIGIVLSLHFGLFHILSLIWRANGIHAEPIMSFPLASQSLSEFWGRRWNLAFRDLTYRFVFRPLSKHFGPGGAMLAGFVISGLIHDAVISIPARAGYGGPTAFFVAQAVGIALERGHWGHSAGLGRGLKGRLYCLAFLVLPLPLLFHRVFVCCVIVPFLAAIRNTL